VGSSGDLLAGEEIRRRVVLSVVPSRGFIWERSNDSEIRLRVRTVRASVPNFVPTTNPDDLR